MRDVSLIGFSRQNTETGRLCSALDSVVLSQLSSKWESPIDPSAEFRLFLSLNRSGSLLSSATTRQLEIWDTDTNTIREVISDDFTGVSSMTWRGDDSYYLGSHNSTIRFYRNGACEQVLELNRTEDLLIAGSVCSAIYLWSVESGRLLDVLNSRSEDATDVNVVSCLSAHTCIPSVFASGSRDGKISVWDVRCPEKLIWRYWAHDGKLSSLQFSDDGIRILSSGREGIIRLWDTRALPPCEERISDFVRCYSGHVARGHWVPAHFLNNEQFVLTGSETNKAVIYDTCTGAIVRVLTLGTSKVIFTAPMPGSVAFYYVNLSTQTIGLCDVHGENAKPQEETPVQIRQNFLKEKMQEVMLDYSDMIIGQLARLGVLENTGLHQIIDTLSRSPDPQSQSIMGLLMTEYEAKVRNSQQELAERIMSSAVLPSHIFQSPVKSEESRPAMEVEGTPHTRTELAPTVRKECGVSTALHTLCVQVQEVEAEMAVDKDHRECFCCHYCCEDGDP